MLAPQAMNPRNVLVVYYSLSGTTRALADLIAAALDADVEELHDVHERRGMRGWLRSAVEATLSRRGAILPQRRDPSHYDLVVIGTPVWNARVSSPVRTWLQDNARRLPPVALFATMGGRGGEAAIAQMAGLVGKAPRATLVARNDRVWRGRVVDDVAAFMHGIEQAAPTRPPPSMRTAPVEAPRHA